MRSLALAITIAASGCGARAFVCRDQGECSDGDIAGVCEPTGGCSFPDDGCASGRRYGTHAPDGLAGTCVSETSTGEASSGVDPTVASTPTATTSIDPTTSDATTLDATSTTSVGDTSSTDVATVDASSGEASSTTTGAPPVAGFFDDFERPDADALGNGWVEVTEGAFQLVNGRVALGDTNGLSFSNNVCRRPADEALLDVEASVLVAFSSDTYAGFPQLHLRSQPDADDVITAYVAYVDTTEPKLPPALDVVRLTGGAFTELAQTELAPFPGNDLRYRLRARAVGTDPVVVDAWFEVEIDGAWGELAHTTLVDATEDRIVLPGVVAMSGHVQLEHIAYDDFAYDVTEP